MWQEGLSREGVGSLHQEPQRTLVRSTLLRSPYPEHIMLLETDLSGSAMTIEQNYPQCQGSGLGGPLELILFTQEMKPFLGKFKMSA